MNYTTICAHFSANKGRYLPYLYPVLIPMLSFFASKISVYTVHDFFNYCLSISCLDIILLTLLQNIIYNTTYKQPIKWLIASFIGGIVIYTYLFVEFNYLHLTTSVSSLNKIHFSTRTVLNIPLMLLLVGAIKSAADRKKILIDNALLANENAKAQYNLLLQQINPHFLFNCLTVLQSMTHSKDARTKTFITKLAEVYRQAMKAEKGMVTLREELVFFESYMYLMTLRQENAIFVSVEVSDEALDAHLPAFALQLLAENCIKHNRASLLKPLHIRLYQKNANTLTITNNYQPKTKPVESFGIGIPNLAKRYELSGIAKGISVEKDESAYTVTLKLF